MVLQQEINVPVWGTAEPNGQVIIQIAGQEKKTISGDDGRWRLDLDPLKAGGPHVLSIIGQDTISIHNVLVGEVWLCSGQSNMEMPVSAGWGKVLNHEEEVQNANYNNIRLFRLKHTPRIKPITDINADGWQKCSPKSLPEFSAVAYFFGRKIHQDLKIPVGLVQSAVGGTVVEAWTSGNTLENDPDFADYVRSLKKSEINEEDQWQVYKDKLADWQSSIKVELKKSSGFKQGWTKNDYPATGWKRMNLPGTWEKVGVDVDGIVWFRKEIELSSEWQNKDLELSLGPINDFDITWFNGSEVGSEPHHLIPRKYRIPANLVRKGKNVIVVQVLDLGNVGGLYGRKEQMSLSSKTNKPISLAGDWSYKIEPKNIDPKKLPDSPHMPDDKNRPTVLFNGMIAPLVPYGIRGVIWYQGEGNAGRAYQYQRLFPQLIEDWRRHWQNENLPFLFVQLANFMKRKSQPGDDAWAELREAQLKALDLPHTGMAVTIDIGDAKDIHPKNKQDVGKRLALTALNLVYEKDTTPSGPLYKSMKLDGNKIRLSFDFTDGGIKTPKNEKLKGFAIAGNDKKFVWAEAKIEGDDVVVWSSKIAKPVAVRYAWAANPECNLFNGAGLPASPFRTDSWKGITE
jgi:sialate O-acetylesterase